MYPKYILFNFYVLQCIDKDVYFLWGFREFLFVHIHMYKGEVSSNLFQSKMNRQIKKALKLGYSKCERWDFSDGMFNRILLININLSSFHPRMLKFALEKWMIKLIMKQLTWMKNFLYDYGVFFFVFFLPDSKLPMNKWNCGVKKYIFSNQRQFYW